MPGVERSTGHTHTHTPTENNTPNTYTRNVGEKQVTHKHTFTERKTEIYICKSDRSNSEQALVMRGSRAKRTYMYIYIYTYICIHIGHTHKHTYK